MAFEAKNFLKTQTERPGVYQMFDAQSDILYIGKAKNLKNRLSNYFHGSGLSSKTQALVKRIASIDVTVTETETEALLLEHNLIKENRPPFNIILRDDKSYPYIFLSDKDTWPRLSFHRGKKKYRGRYFGPFPSSQAVRDSMSFLQKTFRVRQCDDVFFKNRSRPCLQFQIMRCTAPCVGFVTKEDYAIDVEFTQLYLDGKADKVLRELECQMEAASEKLDYESAAKKRDQISAMRQIQTDQVIEKGNSNIDVIAAVMRSGDACVHILFVRQGRITGSRSYYPKVPLADEVSEMLEEYLPQMYLGGSGKPDVPKEIFINVSITSKVALENAIYERIGRVVKIREAVRGVRAKWLKLAERTAEQNLAADQSSKATLEKRFASLRDTLGLNSIPQRIECFDISHSSGEAAVASCVVFDNTGALKSDYRRFNILDVNPGDDYAAMRQAVTRRYKRLSNGEGKLPDLLLIDGGKGQIGVVNQVLIELAIVGVVIVGVAKGVTRKSCLETLIICGDPHRTISSPQAGALSLIDQIRDEAHRFAVTGHKQRRDRKRRSSHLEGIPGVGPTRRRELLKHFGGSKEVTKASITDLMRVPNINRTVAEAIHSALYNE